ncbi:ABC transporter ATP-binding protein [Salinispirillum sp. LH 10-3-1]|uniref:ABC transporter ATP-binding protein n=1 Tax=Salinispirillum sp. LH 10-3-1 TaxID=2952525 RepID=UPI00351B4536
MANDNLLEVQGLKKHFPVKNGILQRTTGQIKAVDGITFKVKRGETFGLVGESGCGKSTAGRTIIRLYEPTEGQIIFAGQDVSQAKERDLKTFRRQVQMVFQDPYSSLNPRKTIRTILTEPFDVHGLYDRAERADRVAELMQRVGLDASLINRYPHEFSGGQRQRIGIARSLALNPQMIIGDEPVSALDVSIQSQVLNIMADLQAEFGLTYLFIAHDLAVVKHISDRIGVMYLGHLVELADKHSLYKAPLHPYTQALLSAIPRSHPSQRNAPRQVLQGELPSPANPPTGCVFHTRCPHATARCRDEMPLMKTQGDGHQVACHLHD